MKNKFVGTQTHRPGPERLSVILGPVMQNIKKRHRRGVFDAMSDFHNNRNLSICIDKPRKRKKGSYCIDRPGKTRQAQLWDADFKRF